MNDQMIQTLLRDVKRLKQRADMLEARVNELSEQVEELQNEK